MFTHQSIQTWALTVLSSLFLLAVAVVILTSLYILVTHIKDRIDNIIFCLNKDKKEKLRKLTYKNFITTVIANSPLLPSSLVVKEIRDYQYNDSYNDSYYEVVIGVVCKNDILILIKIKEVLDNHDWDNIIRSINNVLLKE